MLPISELVLVARSVDDDGSSSLALLGAEAWGYDRARFLRSSANHVFVCQGRGGTDGVLRLRPEEHEETPAGLIAETASRLAAEGAPVAPALTSLQGPLAVVIRHGWRRYVATMFLEVAGELLDDTSLTAEAARSWGWALARFHDTASQLDPRPAVPEWIELVAEAAGALAVPENRAAAAEIADELLRLPAHDWHVGLVHGDPELDNLVWDADGRPTFVDVDDMSWSWFAADISFALRDFLTPETIPTEGSQPVGSFLAGYRECRPISVEELNWLPLFRRAHAVVTLARLEHILVEPCDAEWPDWATGLHGRITSVAEQLRGALSTA
jgi:Ser/Thr protein kinase RdoA (MazF antagonist)